MILFKIYFCHPSLLCLLYLLLLLLLSMEHMRTECKIFTERLRSKGKKILKTVLERLL